MPLRALQILFGVATIAGLHAPLVLFALALRDRMGAGLTLADLPPATLAILLGLLLLPYLVLAIARVRWNPERARFDTYTGDD